MSGKGNAGKILTEQQRHWLEHIRACEATGKPMVEYATGNGLDVRRLYQWKKVLVNKGVLARTRPARFQSTQVVTGPVDHEWRILLDIKY